MIKKFLINMNKLIKVIMIIKNLNFIMNLIIKLILIMIFIFVNSFNINVILCLIKRIVKFDDELITINNLDINI